MLLLRKKIQQILIEKGIFTQSNIDELLQEYASSVIKAIFDNIQLYVEQKKLIEAEKYIQTIVDEIKKKKQSNVNDQIKFYSEVLNLLKDYPEIIAWINEDMQTIDNSLNHSILFSVDDDTKSQIMDFIEEDLKQMEINTKIIEEKLASPEFDQV